ncbi:MAG: hypothetical protein JWP74_1064 [Marmoricola sp.]|nr:hypothetical protein [Marmoricola sp.]
MTRAETVRCWIYGLLALVALVGTQWALVSFLSGGGSISAFLNATVDGPVATFTTIDLLCVATVATIFMIVEGRKIGLPVLWLYVVLVFAVAVSVALPLFLIGRTRHLSAVRAG